MSGPALSSEDNPWQTHSSEVVYNNPWIRVIENKVTNPRGGEGIYGVVHFHHQAVGVIPIDEEGHTYLVGQYRYAQQRYEWEMPEGGAEPDEDPLECAKRELLEETGIRAQEFEPLIENMQLSNSVCTEVAYIYVARGLTHHEPDPDPTEQLALRRVSLTEAYAMVDRGEIRDSLTVAGLLRLRVRDLEEKLRVLDAE